MPSATTKLGLPKPLLADGADIEKAVGPLADALDNLILPSSILTGEVRFIATTAAPSNLWLPCDGAARSRATYAALWNVLRDGHAGTAGDPAPFGNGDGSTTFNVPDLRGRTPVGSGTAVGAGIDAPPVARANGAKWGTNTHTLAQAELAAHAHAASTPNAWSGAMNQNAAHGHSISGGLPVYNTGAGAGGQFAYSSTVTMYRSAIGADAANIDHLHYIAAMTVSMNNNTPSGGAHNNAQPSLAIPAYIYAGVLS